MSDTQLCSEHCSRQITGVHPHKPTLVSAAPNKIALVSGGNKGIGKEIVRALAKEGFTVLLGARKPDLGEAAAAELAKDGQVYFQQLDVTDAASVHAAAAAVKEKYGHLDVLVSASTLLLAIQWAVSTWLSWLFLASLS